MGGRGGETLSPWPWSKVVILFLTLIFGHRGEKELIVNRQQEPNYEELSKYLPFCYFLLKREIIIY